MALGGGRLRFIFAPGNDVDVIKDSEDGLDLIDFNAQGIADFAANDLDGSNGLLPFARVWALFRAARPER